MRVLGPTIAAATSPAATSWPAGVRRRASRCCRPDTARKQRYQNRRTLWGSPPGLPL